MQRRRLAISGAWYQKRMTDNPNSSHLLHSCVIRMSGQFTYVERDFHEWVGMGGRGGGERRGQKGNSSTRYTGLIPSSGYGHVATVTISLTFHSHFFSLSLSFSLFLPFFQASNSIFNCSSCINQNKPTSNMSSRV